MKCVVCEGEIKEYNGLQFGINYYCDNCGLQYYKEPKLDQHRK